MHNKLNIEFNITDDKNPYFMSVVDLSNWALLQNSTSFIDVTLPGYSKSVENYYEKNSVNVLNSFNLGINCITDCEPADYEALPDGIYCITVRSECGNHSATKKYLRTTLIDLEIDQILIDRYKDANGCLEVDTTDISEIEFALKAAKANVRYDNLNYANQLFELACDLVEKIKNCS